ncbi:MAG: ATP-binding protein [Nocardioidaceae bacterium]
MSSAPPASTVTMLFSDMEGSTRLLIRLGDAYADVLRVQRQLQREAYERWHGREMGTEGDSFFVTFQSARDAVHACLDAQRSVAAHDWPGGAQVRVRMGVHTGEPTPYEDGFVGLDVHLAARVAATSHGGQVVVSEATCRLVSTQLPADARLRYLGGHRLKDIAEAQDLYQLVAPGLDEEFPPLRSLGTPSNLPGTLGGLIGRERELGELTQMLARSDVRLHTLTGPGGTGKTRLAVAVAEAVADGFPDGVYFVPLASVTDIDVMWTTIAEIMGLAGESKAPPSFLESLADRQVLLVLDNLEQLPDAGAPVVAEMLAAGSRLGVLATSRRPLHVAGGQEYAVQPLAEPAAVGMFEQRARLVRPDFAVSDANRAAVAELCRRLDGLPLALEIAAARAKLLSPQALLDRLDTALELRAGSGQPDRQQTLRATMSWSYDLLPKGQQQHFRRLGVFADSAELDAVAAVTGVPDPLHLVSELVDASLVRVDDGPYGAPRVRLLQTVRRFALSALADSDELVAARQQHAEHYLKLAESAAEDLRGPDTLAARSLLETELANLREALGWCLDDIDTGDQSRLSMGLRMCSALSWFWYTSGYVAEGRAWAHRATARASGDQGPEFASVLHTLAILMLQQGDYRNGRDILAKCLRIWRRLGDQSNVAKELNSLGVACRYLGDDTRARELMLESVAIARETDDKLRLVTALTNLGVLEVDAQRPDRAIDIFLEAEAADHERGDEWGVVTNRVNRVAALLEAARRDEALALLGSMADETLALGDTDLTATLIELYAVCLAVGGDSALGARLSGAAASLREQAELPLSEPDAEFYDRHLMAARAALGGAEWDREAAEGRSLTASEALDHAQAAVSDQDGSYRGGRKGIRPPR